ncbi:MAG: metal ABC transporter permease [Candidatus Electryoneaceae bacterium]|nr:metal ABC transporter permease [Candidatus Electryoneaceae bacterium]
MIEFINALFDPNISFFRYAFIAGIMASLAFGVIGTYVVARRITYIAGAISHSVLGGIGIGLYLQHKVGWIWFEPMYGAVAAALGSALIIGLVSMHSRQREDTVIGAIWAFGMAVGLLFIAVTPGYVDPMSYLFGSILLISKTDLWMVAGLDILVVGLGIYFYNNFLAVCFDDEYARLRGVRVDLYFLLLLCLTALTVVLLVRVVGIVMVIALLTLPAAVAGYIAHRLWQMMIWAVLFSMIFIGVGLGFSYVHNLPSGPTIIVFAGIVYLAVAVGGRFFIQRR